ncbi:phage portal protein, HK97 family [Granulicella pectinivorans]|jgi:HK97 family phage portal protein|uniref:Phage portal protein, HK97 family n=1 Tax=Granulicella pectinivorans TaxID=474950 RepID=A0A1I6LHS0_9BACT|nr:phage portal protein [Granulicella pectinivorans]SFS02848.1 phage portal protein, HK97 family [Granulicella pectinivorans]
MGWIERVRGIFQTKVEPVRKTAMLPSILTPYGGARQGQSVMKMTPANLRRFAETPVARRAINVVKDRIASMDWQVRVRRGYVTGEVTDADARLKALRIALEEPNAGDSFRTLFEQVLEDVLVGGFGAVEMELTGDAAQPFRLWPVDGATIQVDESWDGDAAKPRYAQATGRVGKDALVPLLDDELMYVRLNPRTHTPFGLGRLEVAFETVNQLLGATRYAGRLASNSVVQYALWLNEATPEQHERLIHWWQDEIEGTGKVPILSSEQKPEVLRFAGGTDADLHLQWQEFLLRMIANAFDLPPMLLGVTQDVNKASAAELAEEAFQSAIVPVAKLIAEHITRDVFGKRLGWREFEFVFNDLEARDPMTELSVQTQLLEAGVLTVAEVRSMRGLPALKAKRGAA